MTRHRLLSALSLAAATLAAQMPAPEAAKPPTPLADQDGRPYHLVAEGDSLLSIASTYELTLQRLVALNNVRNNTISVGQKLYLAPPGSKVDLPPRNGVAVPRVDAEGRPFHVVATGENPFAIAARYGVDLYKLIGLNGIQNYTVTPGQKLLLPAAISPASKGNDPPDSDPALTAREASPRAQDVLGAARASRAPQVRSATIPMPRRGVVANPEAGRSAPGNPAFARPAVQPDHLARTSLAELLAPLPLIDKGTFRSEWSRNQEVIATWWEQTAVRTVGILTGCQWTAGPSEAFLVLTLCPSARTSAVVRVSVPAAYLPAEIDTGQINRWAANRVPVEVVGHLRYLDGPGPVASLRARTLLSPWEIVAQHVSVHVPAGPWTSITDRPVPPRPNLPPTPALPRTTESKSQPEVPVVVPTTPEPPPALGQPPQPPAGLSDTALAEPGEPTSSSVESPELPCPAPLPVPARMPKETLALVVDLTVNIPPEPTVCFWPTKPRAPVGRAAF